MSIFLTNAAIKEFDAMVKSVYQATGFLLRSTMRERTNVVGSQIRFTIQGKGIANQKASQDDVVPMNINYTNVETTLQNWHAADYSDIFDQAEVNFDEKKELAKAVAMAIGRRMDQIAIDALNTSGTVATIADGGTGFTYEKFREMNSLLNANGVTRTGSRRYLAMSSAAEDDLLADDKFINSDFFNRRVLDAGNFGLNGIQLPLGYTAIVIPNMTEGGLPLAGNVRKCFAWDHEALGYGIGIDFKTTIDWIAEKTSWLVNGIFKANAVAIDPLGIVEIDFDESV